jgi:hypothetical protein
MSFHFDEAEALAFTSEYIRGHADGAHGAKFSEHGSDGVFSSVLRQVADKQLFHECFLVGVGRLSPAAGKKEPRERGSLVRIDQSPEA